MKKKLYTETVFPKSIDANCPISISYLTESEQLLKTFFRANNETLFELDKPTAFDIYKVVVGCYYCYHLGYSVASKGLMQFLDFCVLGREDEKNRSKLLRDLKKEYSNFVSNEEVHQ